jgi:hypothetical protein
VLKTELFCSSSVNFGNTISSADSLSALHVVDGYSPDNPIVIEILIQVSHLQKSGKSVVFCHTGLPDNEAANAAANAAA